LRTTMHDAEGAAYGIGEDLRTDPDPMAGATDMKSLYADALHRRPELRALDETALSLTKQSDVLRASYFPRLDAVADATYANPSARVFPQKAEFTGSWSAG